MNLAALMGTIIVIMFGIAVAGLIFDENSTPHPSRYKPTPKEECFAKAAMNSMSGIAIASITTRRKNNGPFLRKGS
jgi:hypothetical protein